MTYRKLRTELEIILYVIIINELVCEHTGDEKKMI